MRLNIWIVGLITANTIVFSTNASNALAEDTVVDKAAPALTDTDSPMSVNAKDKSIRSSVNTITSEEEPIKGFHPIKKAIAPILRLEKNSIELQKQIKQLTGPISDLGPVMLNLHSEMDSVNGRMAAVQKLLNTMSAHVRAVSSGMDQVGDKMEQVRDDIGGMRAQIGQLEIPIRELQKPLHELEDPLRQIAQPLRDLHSELNELKALLATVLFAIVAAAATIAIGMPVAAVMIYKYRTKLFKHIQEMETVGKLSPNPNDTPEDDTIPQHG